MARTLQALVVAVSLLASGAQAHADVAGPSPGPEGRCEPDEEEGDSCVTEDGEDGTCTDETVTCYDPRLGAYGSCAVCEEGAGCSVGAMGSTSAGGQAWMGLGALALAAAAGLRLRSERRAKSRPR